MQVAAGVVSVARQCQSWCLYESLGLFLKGGRCLPTASSIIFKTGRSGEGCPLRCVSLEIKSLTRALVRFLSIYHWPKQNLMFNPCCKGVWERAVWIFHSLLRKQARENAMNSLSCSSTLIIGSAFQPVRKPVGCSDWDSEIEFMV